MAAIHLPNSTVVGNKTVPTPSPIGRLFTPINLDAVDIGEVLSPLILSPIAAGLIGSAVIITPATTATLNTPTIVSSLPALAIDTPVINTPLAVAVLATPIINTPLAVVTLATPVINTPLAVATLNTPVINTPLAAAVLATPVIIAANALDPTTPPFPLNHARILYNNLLVTSTVTTSTGTTPEYSIIPNTYQSWAFSVAGWVKYVLPTNQLIDTVCIGAHNLFTNGYSAQAFYRTITGGALVAFDVTRVTTTNDAIMFHVDTAVNAKVIEVHTTVGAGDSSIGFVSAGVAMQMPRPFFSGHNPMNQNRKTRFYDAWTETGQMVGRAKRSVQLDGDFTWDNIPDAWYRNYMPAFILSASQLPYFISWNLSQHPNDTAMAFTDDDINAPYSGTRDLRSLSFSARGIA